MRLETKDNNFDEYQKIPENIIKEVIDCIKENSKQVDMPDLPIEHKIIMAANQIAIATSRGAGNYAIFSESSFDKFLETNPISYRSDTINGTIKCYVSKDLKDGIIVGYQDFACFDGGIVLSIVNDSYKLVVDDYCKRYYQFIG